MATSLGHRKTPRPVLVEKDAAVILADFTVREGDDKRFAMGDDEKMYWYNPADQKWYLSN